MRIHNVGICDKDAGYAVNVTEYLNTEKELHLNVSAFTKMQAVEDYLKHKELDVLLTDDTSGCTESEGMKFFKDVRCVPLLEYRGEEPDGIFKYQDIRTISRELFGKLAPFTENPSKISSCLCVFSPLGRCGKTNFAKALAASDEVRGGLYVGMEDYSGLSVETEASGILYQIKQRMSDIEEILADRIHTFDHIKMLQAAGTYFDMREISKDDIEWLNEILYQSGICTTIVYDLGCCAMEDYEILSCFEQIYMPVLPDEISRNKIQRFERMMRDMGYRGILSKIVKVEVPEADYDSPEMIRAIWKVKHGGD